MSDTPRYTIINQEARAKLGLTLLEYVLADIIYNLQNNPRNSGKWAYVSTNWLSEFLLIPQKTIYRAIKTLEAKKLLSRQPSIINRASGYRMQVTLDWYDRVVIKRSSQNDLTNVRSSQNVHKSSQNDNTTNSGGSSQNDNVIRNNKDNNKDNVKNTKSSKEYKSYLKAKQQLNRKKKMP